MLLSTPLQRLKSSIGMNRFLVILSVTLTAGVNQTMTWGGVPDLKTWKENGGSVRL